MPLKLTLLPQLTVTARTVLGSHLLRLAEVDLEDAIAREVVDNPALEWDADNLTRLPDLSSHAGIERTAAAENDDDGDSVERVAAQVPILDQLIQQARLLLPHDDLAYVAYLISMLDEHGFLTTPSDQLARELDLPPESLERVIGLLQQLDPPGLGARDVRECLRLQCEAVESHGVDCRTLRRILDEAWDAFVQQRWQQVARTIGRPVVEVHDAVRILRHHFYPFPLALMPGGEHARSTLTRPDLVVRRTGTEGAQRFTVDVPGAESAHLRINPLYELAARGGVGGLSPAESAWVEQAVQQARLFIGAVEQRYATLRQIGEFLVNFQAEFFARGRRHIKPLTRTQAAHALGIHPSTVSRAVSDKVLQLPDGGLMELRELFDASLAVKEAIRDLLTTSAEPLSDREIARQLCLQAFNVSRRTVAQYREDLGIPARGLRQRNRILVEQLT